MVVPVGLEVEGSNNDHLPESAEYCLEDVLQQHLENKLAQSKSSSPEKLESGTQDSDQGLVQQQLYKSWSFSLSTKELHDNNAVMKAWNPRSSFLQQILQQKSSNLLFPPTGQQPFSLETGKYDSDVAAAAALDTARKGVASTVDKAVTMHTIAPDKSVESSKLKDAACSSSQHRREDSTLIARGGKMTSLGASPKCNVCSHKPNEARVVTFCGHLFCWPCLCCWLHNKSPNKECPVCNRPLTKNHITPLHGRQNSLTVARLQGMLRTDKATPRTHSNSSGRRQLKGATPSTVVSTVSTAVNNTGVSNSTPIISPSRVEDSIRRLLSRQVSSFTPTNFLENRNSNPPAASDAVNNPVIVLPETAPTLTSRVVSSPQQQLGRPQLFPLVSANTSGVTISTTSTVVTTDITPMDSKMLHEENHSPTRELFEEGPQEIRELGVLLSLEWEGAMSAIENAWWDAVSDVLDRNKVIDDTPQLMTVVERLSKEKEKIIHELASEPLEGSHWLPARLDSFRTMTTEELHSLDPMLQGELPKEIEDWFSNAPDNFEALFPELDSWENIKDDQQSLSWIEEATMCQPDLQPCRLQKKRKLDEDTVAKCFQL